MPLINYTVCPVCGGDFLVACFQVKDYTVSQNNFEIISCSNCKVRLTQNVPDAEGIGPYYKSENYISHTNTNKGLVNKLYGFVRNYTLKRKKKLVQRATGKQAGSLLDVGSGVGSFANIMQQYQWRVTALEPDTDARSKAKELYNLQLQPSEQLFNLPDNSYDAITLWHVLEHVHALEKYLQTFNRLLTANGTLIIAVPNYTSYDADVYGPYWAAYDVPRHLYHFSPHSMKVLMQRYGFCVEKMKPMWFDSFYVSLLSNRYRYGRFRYWKAAVTGLWSNIKALANAEKCSSVIYVIKKKEV